MTNKTERNLAIVAAKASGETITQIARRFGISTVRVRQILARHERRLKRK